MLTLSFRHWASAALLAGGLLGSLPTLADQPPPALVQRLAQRYTATQGDIAAVMRALIESPETWDMNNRLFKTPLDYACSVLAATGGVQDADPDVAGLEGVEATGEAVADDDWCPRIEVRQVRMPLDSDRPRIRDRGWCRSERKLVVRSPSRLRYLRPCHHFRRRLE